MGTTAARNNVNQMILLTVLINTLDIYIVNKKNNYTIIES